MLLNSELPLQRRASGLQHQEVFFGGMANGWKRDSAIECHESSAVTYGEAEQIHVRNLSRTVDPRCIECG